MSNPATCAALHNRRLEDIRKDRTNSAPKDSILKWCHWKVSIPAEGKIVVISNEQNILIAKRTGENKWKAGVQVLAFEDYPLWAEQPSFANTAKKVKQVSKDLENLAATR